MHDLTTQLAIDLAPKGVRVNAVMAGGSICLDGGSGQRSSNVLLRHVDSALIDPEDATKSPTPLLKPFGLNRTGSVHEIASTIRFLASDDASFITGQTISVDGGSSLKP